MLMEYETVSVDAERATAFDFDRELVRSMPEMERFARRLTRNPSEAEDLVQDCLERALRNRDKFEPGTNLQAWLTTMMKNLHFTRCSRERRVCRTELTEDTVTSPPTQDWQVMLHEVGEALEDLTPDHRRLIRMVAIDGASYQNAADELRVSIGTVRSRLSRARAQLRIGGKHAPAATGRRPGPAEAEVQARKPAPDASRTAPAIRPPSLRISFLRISPLTPGPAPRRPLSVVARHQPAKPRPTACTAVGRPVVWTGPRRPASWSAPAARAGRRVFYGVPANGRQAGPPCRQASRGPPPRPCRSARQPRWSGTPRAPPSRHPAARPACRQGHRPGQPPAIRRAMH